MWRVDIFLWRGEFFKIGKHGPHVYQRNESILSFFVVQIYGKKVKPNYARKQITYWNKFSFKIIV